MCVCVLLAELDFNSNSHPHRASDSEDIIVFISFSMFLRISSLFFQYIWTLYCTLCKHQVLPLCIFLLLTTTSATCKLKQRPRVSTDNQKVRQMIIFVTETYATDLVSCVKVLFFQFFNTLLNSSYSRFTSRGYRTCCGFCHELTTVTCVVVWAACYSVYSVPHKLNTVPQRTVY